MKPFPLFEADAILLSKDPLEDPDAIFAYTIVNDNDEATGYVIGVAKEFTPNQYTVYSPGFESAPWIHRKLIAAAELGSRSPNVMQSLASRRALKFNLSWEAIHIAANADPSKAWYKALYDSFSESILQSGTMISAYDPENDDPVCREILELIFNATPENREKALPTITRWIVDQGSVQEYGSHRSQRDGRAEELRILLDSSSDDDLGYPDSSRTTTQLTEDLT